MTQNKLPDITNDQHDEVIGPDNDQSPELPTSLQIYADRADVSELASRITQMLPAVKALGNAGALALAQVSIAMGLNPFIGELWAIPKKGGGFSLMTGIKGLRRAARNQAAADNGMYVVSFRQATHAEADGLRVNPGDIIRACDLYQDSEKARRFYEFTGKHPIFTGLGAYRQGEMTQMNPLQVARKRAEADALKQAYDLPIGLTPNVEDIDSDQPYPLPAEPTTRGRAKLFKDKCPSDLGASSPKPQMIHVPADSIAQPVQPASPTQHALWNPESHWYNDVTARDRWWEWCKNEHNLSSQQVHRLLHVDSMHDYSGSHEQAKWELEISLLAKDPTAIDDVPAPPEDVQEEDECPD